MGAALCVVERARWQHFASCAKPGKASQPKLAVFIGAAVSCRGTSREAQIGAAAAALDPGDAPECLGSTDDCDALIGLQVEKVRIAGNDEVGLRGERAGKHVIVVGIIEDDGRDFGCRDDPHDIEVARHQLFRGQPACGHRSRELVSRKHVGELGKEPGAGIEIDATACLGEQGVLSAFPEKSRDDGTGVQDEPHPGDSLRRGAAALGPVGLDLGVDFFRRHRLYARRLDPIGDRQQRIVGLATQRLCDE